MNTRYFVMTAGATPEDLLDKAERHGEIRRAVMYPTPANGQPVYGPVEIVLAPGERSER